MKYEVVLGSVMVLLGAVSLSAESIAFTESKPGDTWVRKQFDASRWRMVDGWEELGKEIHGEAWIRVEQAFSIKELNNLVVAGEFTGSLAISINGREEYSIHGDGAKAGVWALTKAGIGYSATVERPAVFGFHYLPQKGRPALCAVRLKPLPLDYLEENTPTKKWVVMDGTRTYLMIVC